MDKMDWPAVESQPVLENERRQQEGQIFHRLVQQHLLGLPVQKLEELANTPNLVRWWKSWLAFRGSTDLGEPMPELTLACPIGMHRLLAKYDMLRTENGNATIYDWKTYAKRPRDEWLAARWQTRVYPALLVQAGAYLNNGQPFDPEQIELIFWFADYPSEPAKFSYSERQFKRDWSAIERTVGEISTADIFPLTKDQNTCAFCVYRSYCNRGKQAAEGQDTDAVVDAETNFDIQFEQIEEIEY